MENLIQRFLYNLVFTCDNAAATIEGGSGQIGGLPYVNLCANGLRAQITVIQCDGGRRTYFVRVDRDEVDTQC